MNRNEEAVYVVACFPDGKVSQTYFDSVEGVRLWRAQMSAQGLVSHIITREQYGVLLTKAHRASIAYGQIVLRDETPQELRRPEYPPIAVQLDALWHAMDSGEIPKAKQFYDDIKKIKDKYPKP